MSGGSYNYLYQLVDYFDVLVEQHSDIQKMAERLRQLGYADAAADMPCRQRYQQLQDEETASIGKVRAIERQIKYRIGKIRDLEGEMPVLYDKLGQPFKVGDRIAWAHSGYAGVRIGYVHSVGTKNIQFATSREAQHYYASSDAKNFIVVESICQERNIEGVPK